MSGSDIPGSVQIPAGLSEDVRSLAYAYGYSESTILILALEAFDVRGRLFRARQSVDLDQLMELLEPASVKLSAGRGTDQ